MNQHDFKSLDRRIGCFQRLECSHRPDQLFKLAVFGFDDIVQIFDLPMHKPFWAFAFGLQFCNRNAAGRGLVGVDDDWLFAV